MARARCSMGSAERRNGAEGRLSLGLPAPIEPLERCQSFLGQQRSGSAATERLQMLACRRRADLFEEQDAAQSAPQVRVPG